MVSASAHVGGVAPRKRGGLNKVLEKYPDATIFTFKDEICLRTNPDREVNVELEDLADPTSEKPWSKGEIKRFHDIAAEAAEQLRDGKDILCVCVGGKNRSRALAIAAHTLSGLSVEGLEEPPCEHLLKLAKTTSLEDALELAPLPPPKGQSRPKRGRAE
jgi:hypothetical protein